VTFRRPLDDRHLLSEAVREGVTFTPGGAITVEGDGLTGLRISFPLLDEQRIDEGVRRLAVAVRAVSRASTSRVASAIS
jgi:DNA-binding transcriptional MocR family regulator